MRHRLKAHCGTQREDSPSSGDGNIHGPLPVPGAQKGPLFRGRNWVAPRSCTLSSQCMGWERFLFPSIENHHKGEHEHGKNDAPHPLGLYGAAAPAAAADGADDGDFASDLFPLRLHPAGHPRHRGQRGAACQGRRRNREADLPFSEGRRGPGPAL